MKNYPIKILALLLMTTSLANAQYVVNLDKPRGPASLDTLGNLSNQKVMATGSVVARALGSRSADRYNVLDWGIDSTGATDNTTKLQTMATAMGSSGGVIIFPKGNYKILGAWYHGDNIAIEIDSGVVFPNGTHSNSDADTSVLSGQQAAKSVLRTSSTDNNTWGLFVSQLIAGPSGPGTNNEKAAIYAISSGYSSSVYASSTGYDTATTFRDIVGLQANGQLLGTTQTGRAWGATVGAAAQPGTDGTLTGLEVDLNNNGMSQGENSRKTSKVGVNVVNFGPNAVTNAYQITNGGSTFFDGYSVFKNAVSRYAFVLRDLSSYPSVVPYFVDNSGNVLANSMAIGNGTLPNFGIALGFGGSTVVGIDFGAATFSGPALRFAANQYIARETSGVITDGWDGSKYNMKNGATSMFNVDGSGNMAVNGRLAINNIPSTSAFQVGVSTGGVGAALRVTTDGISGTQIDATNLNQSSYVAATLGGSSINLNANGGNISLIGNTIGYGSITATTLAATTAINLTSSFTNQTAYGRYSQGRNIINLTIPATSQGVQIGNYATVNILPSSGSLGNLGHVIGMFGEVNNQSNATQPLLVGVEGQVSNSSSGRMTNIYGMVTHLLTNYGSIGYYAAYQDIGIDNTSGGTYDSYASFACQDQGHIPGITDNSGAATCLNNSDALRPIVSKGPFQAVGSANIGIFKGGSAGNPVVLQAAGEANAGLYLGSQGTGSTFLGNAGGIALEAQYRAAAVNRLTLQGGIHNDYVILGTTGSDPTVNLLISPSGTLYFGGTSATFLSTNLVANQVTVGQDLVLARHIVGPSTAQPTTSAGIVYTGSSDLRGELALPTGTTSAVITFNTAFGSAPFCVLTTSNTGSVAAITAASTTSMTISLSANTANVNTYWHCIQ